MEERDMGIDAILKRVADGMSTVADANRLYELLHSQERERIVAAYERFAWASRN